VVSKLLLREESRFWNLLHVLYFLVRIYHLLTRLFSSEYNNNPIILQQFLDRVVDMHKSIDLEWLRYAPPDDVK
jgi:hypothetical protein